MHSAIGEGAGVEDKEVLGGVWGAHCLVGRMVVVLLGGWSIVWWVVLVGGDCLVGGLVGSVGW